MKSIFLIFSNYSQFRLADIKNQMLNCSFHGPIYLFYNVKYSLRKKSSDLSDMHNKAIKLNLRDFQTIFFWLKGSNTVSPCVMNLLKCTNV